MRTTETIRVFPAVPWGGAKFKGEEYTPGAAGPVRLARLSVHHNYPIPCPSAGRRRRRLRRVLTNPPGRWGQLIHGLTEKLSRVAPTWLSRLWSWIGPTSDSDTRPQRDVFAFAAPHQHQAKRRTGLGR